MWFDPSCPYTWLTSRWLVEAAAVRPVDLDWRVMSLAVLNEGRDDDPEGDPEGYLWVPARVCAAVREHHGSAALGRFYTALWTTPETGEPLGDLAAALAAAGLPRDLAETGLSQEADHLVRASHAEALRQVGDHVGTPVIAAEGPGGRAAFFGPVISEPVRGEAAGHLWDGVLLVARTPGFHELKGRPHAEPRTADAR
ncbi:disulfide bond formation protein DsbA [Streptomonospora sp. S1-112]|uniref:Disulfide bond formation protein DsbA n=1 Tax=Streptomonospora mangrovi TaxID=2883123 RepID=A0A9X3SI27_9ACTN|nr:disulfide bond formation protein DsbA [Streptomonospora mangrovi]MDA0567750.1 disulfide bond formation protein DsbA [Streptomonospora mangrovi]